MTEQLKSATRDGVVLRYMEAGAGDPPLLFIHGWTCNNTHWRDQVPHFAKKHRVVALDLRGHGQSDTPNEDSSIATFVDDIAWLIGELSLVKPVVVGHSMGGVIALSLARKDPKLVSAIVMVDAPIFPLPDTLRPVVDQLLGGLQTPAYSAIAEGFARQFFFNEKTPAGMADATIANMGASQRVTHTALASTLSPENSPAGPIPVPALFIRAETQFASEDDLRSRYPGLSVITVPSAHFVQLEQPAATNNIIADFLDKLE
jgi:pimeloyl-ACP methyl ester carboxylesterase